MTDLKNQRGETLYLINGVLCIAVACAATFGAMFSSIEFAMASIFLVVLPLLVGMAGSASSSPWYSALALFGVTVAAGYVLVVFGREIHAGLTTNGFFHELWAWIYLCPNLLQFLLALNRIKQLRTSNEVTT